jgi:hypothetical protein
MQWRASHLAEVEAAVRAVTGGGPGTGIFLDVRLSRLMASADDAIAAAQAGTSPSCAVTCPGSRR